jgi:ABC-type multidrug transport system fused ATPase/permease subunit
MGMLKKCWFIISNKSKIRIKLYLVLVFFVSILEIVGIGLIVPIIGAISNDFTNNLFLNSLINLFKIDKQYELVAILLLFFLIFILIKNIFISFFYYYESFVSENIQAETAQRLFLNYLCSPYQFHLNISSSKLVRNVHSETEIFSVTVKSIILLISETVLTIFILSLLIFIEPIGTILIILIFLVTSILFLSLTKSRVKSYSKSRIKFSGKSLKVIMEGLSCIKDIKILSKENFFIQNLIKNLNKKKIAIIWFNFFSNLPRLFLEIIIVTSVCILLFFLISKSYTTGEIFKVVGVFVASAFRLLPSINRMNLSYQRLLWGSPTIDSIYSDLKHNDKNNFFQNFEEKQKKNNFNFKKEITLRNVGFNYKENSKFNIKNISFSIKKGESIGIVGKSGSGKSTLLNIILGLLKPKSGQILFDGININNIKKWNRQIGYVTQNVYLTDDTIFNNIAFGVGTDKSKEEKVIKSIKKAQLEKFVSSLSKKEKTVVGEKGIRLSGGQIQRIGIARALYHNPCILVLDEASSALDYKTESSLMSAVNLLKGKTTLIIVTHRLSTVENCDKVIEIKNGKIKNITTKK